MGWLWMCLGIKGKSARRIGGRVSSDTYLAPQFDPTKTPRIEDFLQPRQAGYDVFVNGHPSESPRSDGDWEEDLDSGSSGTHEGSHGGAESIKAEYRPYWGYTEDLPAREGAVSIEFPRATPAARKSFSELLRETDSLEKGSLALAAVATAAAERTSRLKLQKGGSSSFPGFQTKEAQKPEDMARDHTNAAAESPAPHSTPSISSLSKDHLEASNAVAAFKESRRQSHQHSESTTQQHEPAVANPAYISNLFRSSRKRSLPLRSRSFHRPLSPVPEALSLEDELRSKRKSDVSLPAMRGESGDGITKSIMESFSCEMELPSASGKPSLSGVELQRQEDWDDYVLVERTTHDATPASGPQNGVENQGQDGNNQRRDEDLATSSVDGRILDDGADSKAALQDDATSKVVSRSTQSAGGGHAGLDSERHEEDDSQLLRTPVRDFMVTLEVFISPKTTSSEHNFQRVRDMDPEERPIFGSLADHWEAAWAMKRPVWDGRGILNDTNKYREDQKVMWHAVPFEERLAQALATQEDPVLQRRNSFKTPSSQLSASRSSRSLRAH